jgi:dimethylhistidine N-methyltransferase
VYRPDPQPDAQRASALQGSDLDIVRLSATLEPDRARFERDVLAGLARPLKTLSSMYLYDDRGSELFRRIMDLPEYYVTRVEREILERHAPSIAAPLRDGPLDVIDLGAGDGLKTRILLEQFRALGRHVRYLPIDVSEHALRTVLAATRAEQPWLGASGILAEYDQGIRWLSQRDPSRRRLVLLLGSNIGNLAAGEARRFFRRLRRSLRPGDHALIGFDLQKDVDVLQRAYDDSAGVTAEFNLNLLRRINRELAGDFELSGFRHYATYSPARAAMESYLLSQHEQRVRVAGQVFAFEAFEPIRTEISCKYRPTAVRGFARDAGFEEAGLYFDERRYFVDALWSVGADPSALRQ